MKIILMMVLMLGVAESRTAIVFGTNYSSFDSANDYDEFYVDSFDEQGINLNKENIMGFRLGIESISKNLITGFTYSQRGALIKFDDFINGEMGVTMEYLTGYALLQVPLGSLSLLVGGEAGYFMSAEFQQDLEDISGYGINESEEIDSDDWENIGGNFSDYGLVFGAKFDISPKLSAVGTYYFGVAEWGEDSDDELTTYYGAGDFKHRGFQIYLSYGL